MKLDLKHDHLHGNNTSGDIIYMHWYFCNINANN